MSELQFDVAGAEGPKRYFEALTPDRLAHAYLFSGPPGAGKKTFARRLAQSLLCLAPKTGVLGYDGTCSSCALFRGESAHHPDFIEHEGVLRIGDQDARAGFHESQELSSRDLVHLFSLQSYGGGRRILLLGDVGFATHEAANALLRFLEEPPRGVVAILTSATPGRLLPTIRSRLIELRFPNVARSLEALEGEEDSLRAQVVRWFFESLAGNSPQDAWASRETLDDGLETVKTLVRDWIVASGGDGAALLSLDQAERLRGLAAIDRRAATALLGKLDEAQRLARTNVNPALVSELVRMALTSSL
ncbi:MAG TPA: hypothetical protein VMU38_01975 [Candidatus Binatia bacterium]|nr:hypothetical protein [Candidatus Binatia bacterium]